MVMLLKINDGLPTISIIYLGQIMFRVIIIMMT